jgi:N-methylhydantoinase B
MPALDALTEGLGTTAASPSATTDGILRRPEVDPAFLGDEIWDGRGELPYVPPPGPDLRISDRLKLHSEFDLEIDPFTYQVLRNRFWSINLDHSDTIRRVSGSPVIVYMDDFNTALLTETADLVMCGPSIQWFAGMADIPTKWILENRSANPGIAEGDVFFHNDPYVGCIHQMDTAMFAPIFWEGRLFCWAFSQCHAGDVGGPFPGSFNPLATEVHEEAAIVPPIKLVEGGELQQDVLEMHTRKSRTPDLLGLGMRSQIAGLRTVRKRMAEVLEEHGPEVVKGAMRRMIRDCSQAIGQRLLRVPDGQWRQRYYLGGLGPEDRGAHRFEIALRKEGDRLTFTNAGTDPQYHSANGTYSTWRSGIVVAVTNFLGWDQMLCNAGALDHVSLEPVAGTLSIARYPGATSGVGGNNGAVYGGGLALSQMLLSAPDDLRRRANGAGGQAVTSFWFGAGLDRNGKFVIECPGDLMAGAIGAFPERDGVDEGGAWWWPNNTTGNVEDWEAAMPVLYLYRAEKVGGGGPGRWRGGNSVDIAVVPHKTEELTVQMVAMEGAVNTAIGLSGGLPGDPGGYELARGAGVRDRLARGWLPADGAALARDLDDGLERLSTKAAVPLSPDDVFVARFCGGGGYGDPLTRDPWRVADDVAHRRTPPDAARRHYGVVLAEGGTADEDATRLLRQELRAARLEAASEPEEAGSGTLESATAQVTDGVVRGRREGEEAPRLGCAGCHADLGPAHGNFKRYAARLDRAPTEVDPLMYVDPREATDADLVFRQHVCPGCGALLSTELCPRSAEPLREARLALPDLAPAAVEGGA